MLELKRHYITIILAFLYWSMGELSFHLLTEENIITLGIFLPEGIALGFALVFGYRVVGGIFLGQFILAFMNNISLEASLGIALVNSLEAAVAIYVAGLLKLDLRLRKARDIFLLFAMILFILQPISAFGGNFILHYFGKVEGDLLRNIFSWWFGNVMGQMLVTPFILLFLKEYRKISLKEFFLYALAFFVLEYTLEVLLVEKNSFLLLSMTLPIIVYVIFKKGLLYGLMFNIIAALVSSYAVYLGIGAFSSNSLVDNTINYNLFVLAHITISLTAGVLLEERKNYQEQLEERVATEVEKNRQQQLFILEQSRLAQMGEMISMIAHQWRQPLNNLSMINQLLLSKYYKGKLDRESVEYFQINSQKQIAYMSQTIDDFRNFFETNQNRDYFNLDKVISNLLEMTAAVYQAYEITIEYRCKESVEFYGKANEFSHVLLNIINNAKDALLERNVADKKITITLAKESEYIKVEIADNGGGIDEKIIDKIFDPYFSTKKAKNGTGLGLYMSKMIVEEQMGGHLLVRNTKEGALFTITFTTLS